MTSDVIQILVNDSGVSTVVGNSSVYDNRVKVYPVVAPQKEKEPFVTVIKVKTEPFSTFNCLSSKDHVYYETHSWSKNFITTESIDAACRIALESGTMILVNSIDSFDQESDMYSQISTYKRLETR